MDSNSVIFEVYAPGCVHCGRQLELKHEIQLNVGVHRMLKRAGFPDWAIWEEKQNRSVSIFLRDTLMRLNADAIGFSSMIDNGDNWYLYGRTLDELTRMEDYTMQLPEGVTRVRTSRVTS
jgi:hypothetical protein